MLAGIWLGQFGQIVRIGKLQLTGVLIIVENNAN